MPQIKNNLTSPSLKRLVVSTLVGGGAACLLLIPIAPQSAGIVTFSITIFLGLIDGMLVAWLHTNRSLLKALSEKSVTSGFAILRAFIVPIAAVVISPLLGFELHIERYTIAVVGEVWLLFAACLWMTGQLEILVNIERMQVQGDKA